MVVDAYSEIQDSSENQPRQLGVKPKMRVTEEHTQCESIHTVQKQADLNHIWFRDIYQRC